MCLNFIINHKNPQMTSSANLEPLSLKIAHKFHCPQITSLFFINSDEFSESCACVGGARCRRICSGSTRIFQLDYGPKSACQPYKIHFRRAMWVNRLVWTHFRFRLSANITWISKYPDHKISCLFVFSVNRKCLKTNVLGPKTMTKWFVDQ